MHNDIMLWMKGIYRKHPELFHGESVLECGSNVSRNCISPRIFWSDCPDYTGLDCRPGRGVDAVSLVHEYEPGRQFGVVVSAQMLEHDPHWQQSVERMIELVEPGGALILTWAGPGWKEHDPDDSPEPGYYETRTMSEVVEVIGPDAFGDVQAFEMQRCGYGEDDYLLALDKKEQQ